MRLLISLLVVGLLWSGRVEAGWLDGLLGKRRLPKPIDSPIVRPKVKDGHKPGKRGGRHPENSVRLTVSANERA